MNVAVVDDEAGVREAVSYALEEAGYQVSCFKDGEEALAAWSNTLPDLLILDIIMPRLDGLELCRRVRSRSSGTPVIFLSSKDDEIDRVVGLELGADDYVCKPFSVRELVARVRALERRLRLPVSDAELAGPAGAPDLNGVERPSRLQHGDLTLDIGALSVFWCGQRIECTVTEFRLLETLVRHAGAVLSREQLLNAAYPNDVYVTERSIDSHIRRIRKKFEATGREFDMLSAVYGAGYRLAREVPA
jgi:two-component system response regulator ChvI